MLPGIDVSHWQNEIDWRAVARDNCRFAFIKATEGATYQDPRFAANRAAATEAGIAVGAYHYLRQTSTIPDQLANFTNIVHTLRPGDLPPALDVEDPKQWSGVAAAELTELVLSWLRGAHRTFGIRPLIYLSPAFAESLLTPTTAELANFPLWIAHWKADQPRIPKPWQSWTFWQHSSTGSINGIHGKVDLDWFTGDDEQFQQLRV